MPAMTCSIRIRGRRDCGDVIEDHGRQPHDATRVLTNLAGPLWMPGLPRMSGQLMPIHVLSCCMICPAQQPDQPRSGARNRREFCNEDVP